PWLKSNSQSLHQTQGDSTSEGHSKLETIRCLKRYLAREVYYLLNPGPQTITPNTRHHRKAA
ncbi:hypothetical protein O4271_31940, partial [Rhodococcus qingshengii]|nr:hypothetical protein [Rhodococcus qingshengii]